MHQVSSLYTFPVSCSWKNCSCYLKLTNASIFIPPHLSCLMFVEELVVLSETEECSNFYSSPPLLPLFMEELFMCYLKLTNAVISLPPHLFCVMFMEELFMLSKTDECSNFCSSTPLLSHFCGRTVSPYTHTCIATVCGEVVCHCLISTTLLLFDLLCHWQHSK